MSTAPKPPSSGRDDPKSAAPPSAPWGKASATPSAASGRFPAQGARRRCALVVDDDQSSLGMFVRILLKNPGVEVFAATGPAQALELLRSLEPGSPPMVVFLDVMVPALDGPAFVRTLRATPGVGDAPIVLISGLTRDALKKTVAEWGADGAIEKTRGLLQVDDAFRSWIERPPTRTGRPY